MLPVNIATEYGRITGEIMIMPISKVRAGISEAGLSVQQKHITCLQHQFFGLDQYRTHGLSRIQDGSTLTSFDACQVGTTLSMTAASGAFSRKQCEAS